MSSNQRLPFQVNVDLETLDFVLAERLGLERLDTGPNSPGYRCYDLSGIPADDAGTKLLQIIKQHSLRYGDPVAFAIILPNLLALESGGEGYAAAEPEQPGQFDDGFDNRGTDKRIRQSKNSRSKNSRRT